jgi:hypothetical protein
MSGLAGVLMRHDFLEAVETLKKMSGMVSIDFSRRNVCKTRRFIGCVSQDKLFVMSLHELTACIYYKLAIDRGLRGCDPDGEQEMHQAHVQEVLNNSRLGSNHSSGANQHTINGNSSSTGPSAGTGVGVQGSGAGRNNYPSYYFSSASVQQDLDTAIRLAPLALEAVYAEDECECQRIAYTQGWVTIVAKTLSGAEEPAYAVFARSGAGGSNDREVVVAIRGTSSVHDIVTDLRAAPQTIPIDQADVDDAMLGKYKPMRPKNEVFTVREENVSPLSPLTTDNEDDENRASEEQFLSLKVAQWEWTNSRDDVTFGCTGKTCRICCGLLSHGLMPRCL